MKGFYVDLVRGRRVAFLAGPFPDEPTARKYERAAVNKAMELDPWAHFDPHGVVSVDREKLPEMKRFPLGKINHLIEIDPNDLLQMEEA
jgi:hypothetical protein